MTKFSQEKELRDAALWAIGDQLRFFNVDGLWEIHETLRNKIDNTRTEQDTLLDN